MSSANRAVTAFEAVVAVALIGMAAAAAVAYQAQVMRRAKALALKADLQSLRAGIEFFRATRGRYPATLEEALAAPLGDAKGGGAAAWSLQDRGQRRVDAFGNPYYYDAVQGAVNSGTPGHETW